MSQHAAKEDWRRQPWPWIILGMLGTTVLACMVTIVIAIKTNDSLVADDYSSQGKAINQRLERDQRALELGLQARVQRSLVGPDLDRLRVELSAPQGKPLPPFIRLELSHPTLADKDVSLQLVQIAPGVYQGQVGRLFKGHWYTSVEDPEKTWRLRSRLEVGDEARL